MGELVTSEIALLMLPLWFWIFIEKMQEKKMEKKRGKMPDWFSMNWRLAIRVLLLVLLSPVVLAFIALSIGKDIKMMIDRLSYWMIGKLCNSDSAPQVS